MKPGSRNRFGVSITAAVAVLLAPVASAQRPEPAPLPSRTAPAARSPQATRVKIMPLGDSITFGTPDRTYGGYRHLLGSLLTDDGYIITFVGSRRSGNGVAAGPENEGHPGWTIPQMKEGIDSNGWLEAYQPDIILLHMGTNDIRQGDAASAPDNLSALLDDILVRLPRTHVIVAQIIPSRRGPARGHRAYNAALPGIVASKGPRASLVDMQNILSPSDYADRLHPNAGGYDKMARAWEPAIRAVLSGSTRSAGPQPPPATSAREEVKPPVVAPPSGTAAAPAIRFVSGSTIKLEQLIGDEDKERHQPTRSQTVARYQVRGTDLGYSFEHEGRAYFLFGDTLGRLDRALDTIATTDARDPELGVRLDFLTVDEPRTPPVKGVRRRRVPPPPRQVHEVRYLTIQPPGISMGAFEVPVSGISLGGQMYVVVSTDHSTDRTTDRSVLTKFIPPASFQPLRTISRLPAGRFIKMSMHGEPGPIAGLPPGGPFVLVWGTGQYRKSDAYLSLVPLAHFETGEGTRYFAGLDPAGAPTWSEKEGDAAPIVANGTLGDLSVTWCRDLGLWLMTYDRRAPSRGIAFCYSRTPWGPWSGPQILFEAVRDGALGKFIHDPRAVPDDGLGGPVIGQGRADPAAVRGGTYAPYVVERWTKVRDSGLDLYYVLSTWNPYVVVLMKSRLQVE
jgi:lysophospholipase L1-like esterase